MKTVSFSSDVQLHVILAAQDGVEPSEFFVGLAQPAHVEEIVVFASQQGRSRNLCHEEIGHIQPGRQDARHDLFGVGGLLILQVVKEPCDEAVGSRHGEAIVQGIQMRRLRSTAGVAGDADVSRVDIAARQQIVESADAVPGLPEGEILAQEGQLVSGQIVGVCTEADGRSRFATWVFQTLSL